MAADGGIGADREVGPTQFVLDLLVALLDPVADAVDPHDLGEVGGRVGPSASRGEPERGRLVARYQVDFSGRVFGSVVATTSRVVPSGPHQPKGASPAHQVVVCPSRNVRVTAVQSPGRSGPSQASPRAASCGVYASSP